MKVWVVGLGYECNNGHRVFFTKQAMDDALAGYNNPLDQQEVELEGFPSLTGDNGVVLKDSDRTVIIHVYPSVSSETPTL